MGSAALWQLARRGVRTLGIDRFAPPHAMGSTHGHSRIIREAYFEHPQYVPLVRRAYQCWAEVEQLSGNPIYRKTGGLMLGPADGTVVAGSRASAVAHNIPHQMLSADEVRARFSGFTPPENFVGLWEERAGLLFPETAVTAHLALARRHGAQVRTDSPVLQWTADQHGVRVQTSGGVVNARVLVLSVGPWISSLLGNLGAVFQIERQVSHWFQPVLNAGGWPVALWEHREGGLFFTIPDSETSLKAGVHHEGESSSPETVNRAPTRAEELKTRRLLARYQPAADGVLRDSAVCLYTNTPDRDFVIDWHPEHGNVLIVSPCSGHGFKFASAIGEVAADLVTSGRTDWDLSPFSIARFSAGIE